MRSRLLAWEESMRWVARGWDCLEEYTHDLWSRLELEEGIDDCRARGIALPESYRRRLALIDRGFRRVTYDSMLCCLMDGEYCRDPGPGFYLRQELKWPKRKFWFLYRWPTGTVWHAPQTRVGSMPP